MQQYGPEVCGVSSLTTPRRNRVKHGRFTALLAGSLLAVTPVFLMPAVAQTAEGSARALPAGSVCLAGEMGRGERRGQSFVIAVPSDRADELRGRGFRDARCARIRLADKSGVCSIAAANDPAINAYFWKLYALTAAEICKITEAAEAQ